jgi:hypothetical protein
MKFRTLVIIILLLLVLIIVPANRSIFKWLGMDQDSQGQVIRPACDPQLASSMPMTLSKTADVPPLIALLTGFGCRLERNPGDTQVSDRFALSTNSFINLSTLSTEAHA